MQMKYIISIVLALAVLSAIPFLFGKKASNVTTQDVFNNLKVEESNSQNTNDEEDMFGQNSNNTNSNTQNSVQNNQTTQSPTPTQSATTPAPAVTTPTPAPAVTTPTPAPAPTPAPTPPSPVNVSIAGFAFSPSVVTVKRGTTVTWTNNDNVPHTSVTSQNGGFDSGMLSKGGKFSFTFQTAGTYDYICGFHPSMRGSVVVTN